MLSKIIFAFIGLAASTYAAPALGDDLVSTCMAKACGRQLTENGWSTLTKGGRVKRAELASCSAYTDCLASDECGSDIVQADLVKLDFCTATDDAGDVAELAADDSPVLGDDPTSQCMAKTCGRQLTENGWSTLTKGKRAALAACSEYTSCLAEDDCGADIKEADLVKLGFCSAEGSADADGGSTMDGFATASDGFVTQFVPGVSLTGAAAEATAAAQEQVAGVEPTSSASVLAIPGAAVFAMLSAILI